jgi:hypothetical protein
MGVSVATGAAGVSVAAGGGATVSAGGATVSAGGTGAEVGAAGVPHAESSMEATMAKAIKTYRVFLIVIFSSLKFVNKQITN